MKNLLRDLGAFALLGTLSLGLGFAANALRPPPEQLSWPADSPRTLSLEEFLTLRESGRGLVFDTRPEAAFRAGHIPGALSLPAADFEGGYLRHREILAADKSRPLVLYCSNSACGLSRSVQRQLEQRGFTNVAIFPGGTFTWKKAGRPLEVAE